MDAAAPHAMMGAGFRANGKSMRLQHPNITQAKSPVQISFNGTPLKALPGESIAAALSAAGILALRETAKGTKRGLWCGMGACFDCVVTVDGKAGQRACMVKVADGMAVASAFPAEPAPLGNAPTQIADQPCDILVVGAGPAGLSAAIAAAEAGADVVVLDERETPGGQYLKPLATSHSHAAPDGQFRQGSALFARARQAGIRFHYGATVWGGFAPDEIAALIEGAAITFRPRRLILAPGAHERPVPFEDVKATLLSCFHRRYAALRHIGLEHVWGGTTALTLNGAPWWGRVAEGLYTSAGCNGAGIVKGSVLGKRLAEYSSGNGSQRDVTASWGTAKWVAPEPFRSIGFNFIAARERRLAGLET